jgi:UDP-glucose-4-epimerase GalE
MNQRILVTGGAGYIGAHCCSALSAAGYLPVSFDDLSTGHSEFVKWGPLVVGDIRDTRKVMQAMLEHKVDAVVHLAASSLVGESVAQPEKYYSNNFGGSLSVLQAMRDARCDHIVFSSTGAVYGHAGSGELSERLPCFPVNPYGRSKMMVEQMLGDYRAAYGLTSFALRYFNASGAQPNAGIGEKRRNETHLIPRALAAVSGQLHDFAIFGDDYDTPDGTAVRDYIHVQDLATAHVRALELLLEGHPGGCCNLGTGQGYSVKEVLSAIATVAGRDVPCTRRERRAGDPPILVADPSGARKILGFRAAWSDLENIVSTAWLWHVAQDPAPRARWDVHAPIGLDGRSGRRSPGSGMLPSVRAAEPSRTR